MIDLSFDCADLARTLSHYTIGFGRFIKDANGADDVVAAGSGTLVTIGRVHGVLTARHVLSNIEHDKTLAVVRFQHRPELFQQQTMDLRQAEFLILPGTDGTLGPDLAFLRLPLVNIENLGGTNSFYPLDAQLPPMRGTYNGLGAIDTVLGVVAEWSHSLEHTPERRRIQFTLLFAGGVTHEAVKHHEGYDLLAFSPTFEDGMAPPDSYGGVSGGGLWRTFFKPDGSNRVVHRRLIGVAFYENKSQSGLVLSCHGPDGKGDTALGKNLHAKDLTSDEVQKKSNEELSATILKGKENMPGFEGRLTQAQINGLVKFIRALKK